MDKYWRIYDTLAANNNIPKSFTAALYKIIQKGQRGGEAKVEDEILDLVNKLKASCNFTEILLKKE